MFPNCGVTFVLGEYRTLAEVHIALTQSHQTISGKLANFYLCQFTLPEKDHLTALLAWYNKIHAIPNGRCDEIYLVAGIYCRWTNKFAEMAAI